MSPQVPSRPSAPTVREQIKHDLRRICNEALAASSGREEHHIIQELTSDADARARIVRHPRIVAEVIKGLPAYKESFYNAVASVRAQAT